MASFTFFLPKISDVRKASADDPSFTADLRVAETAGLVCTFGVACIVSSLTKSYIPAVTALVMALIVIALYESVLHQPAKDK